MIENMALAFEPEIRTDYALFNRQDCIGRKTLALQRKLLNCVVNRFRVNPPVGLPQINTGLRGHQIPYHNLAISLKCSKALSED